MVLASRHRNVNRGRVPGGNGCLSRARRLRCGALRPGSNRRARPAVILCGTAHAAPRDRRHGSVSQGEAFGRVTGRGWPTRWPRARRWSSSPRWPVARRRPVRRATACELAELVRRRRAEQQHRAGRGTGHDLVPGCDRASALRDQRPEGDAGALVRVTRAAWTRRSSSPTPRAPRAPCTATRASRWCPPRRIRRSAWPPSASGTAPVKLITLASGRDGQRRAADRGRAELRRPLPAARPRRPTCASTRRTRPPRCTWPTRRRCAPSRSRPCSSARSRPARAAPRNF